MCLLVAPEDAAHTQHQPAKGMHSADGAPTLSAAFPSSACVVERPRPSEGDSGVEVEGREEGRHPVE